MLAPDAKPCAPGCRPRERPRPKWNGAYPGTLNGGAGRSSELPGPSVPRLPELAKDWFYSLDSDDAAQLLGGIIGVVATALC